MGTDYGMGQVNIDRETGIRYGVISQNEVLQAWADSAEPDYGDPHCGRCGGELVDYRDGAGNSGQWVCESCKIVYGEDWLDNGAEPIDYTLGDGEYQAVCGSDGDIFILRSPYYTYAPYCSPCAPGAGYIRDGGTKGDCRAYCFGPDWFVGGRVPYPVYSVETGELVCAASTGDDEENGD